MYYKFNQSNVCTVCFLKRNDKMSINETHNNNNNNCNTTH